MGELGEQMILVAGLTPVLTHLARIVYRIGCLPFKQGDVGSNPTASTKYYSTHENCHSWEANLNR